MSDPSARSEPGDVNPTDDRVAHLADRTRIRTDDTADVGNSAPRSRAADLSDDMGDAAIDDAIAGDLSIARLRDADSPADDVAPDDARLLERRFIAGLRWLVDQGDAHGVARIGVELDSLRAALNVLDKIGAALEDYTRRATELDRELSAALSMLGPDTLVKSDDTLVQRLAFLRQRMKQDLEVRRQLLAERDAWRSMTTLMTQARAYLHEDR